MPLDNPYLRTAVELGILDEGAARDGHARWQAQLSVNARANVREVLLADGIVSDVDDVRILDFLDGRGRPVGPPPETEIDVESPGAESEWDLEAEIEAPITHRRPIVARTEEVEEWSIEEEAPPTIRVDPSPSSDFEIEDDVRPPSDPLGEAAADGDTEDDATLPLAGIPSPLPGPRPGPATPTIPSPTGRRPPAIPGPVTGRMPTIPSPVTRSSPAIPGPAVDRPPAADGDPPARIGELASSAGDSRASGGAVDGIPARVGGPATDMAESLPAEPVDAFDDDSTGTYDGPIEPVAPREARPEWLTRPGRTASEEVPVDIPVPLENLEDRRSGRPVDGPAPATGDRRVPTAQEHDVDFGGVSGDSIGQATSTLDSPVPSSGPGASSSAFYAASTGGSVSVAGPDLLFGGGEKKFDLGRLLGKGGMGEVKLATDRFLKRHVAIKTLHDNERTGVAAKFVQEARITGQLEHPNIVPIHEIGTDATGRPFMVMKRIKGRSLRDILNDLARGKSAGLELEDMDSSSSGGTSGRHAAARSRSRPSSGRSSTTGSRPAVQRGGKRGGRRRGGSPSRAGRASQAPAEDGQLVVTRLLEIFAKVCDAIAYAHNRGVIHRDLKPANIMVGEFGEVQVMDWGIAKVLGESEVSEDEVEIGDLGDGLKTAHGIVKGTPAFMSPEQAMGKVDEIDHRADVYALGAMLYSILALKPPFEKMPPQILLKRVALGDFEPPSQRAPEREIPRELEAVILKAMSHDPASRYSSAIELKNDIVAYLEGRTLGAARYTFWNLFAKWVQQNKILVGTALGAVASLLVGTYGIIAAIHSSNVREIEQAMENERALLDGEREAREKAEAEAERERRERAVDLQAEAEQALGREVDFNPGAPQHYFQARLPGLLRLGQAIQTHPRPPPAWMSDLRREVEDLQGKAESVGAWALAEHIARSAVQWGALTEVDGQRRLERIRARRQEIDAEDRHRLEDILRRIGEAERR